MIIQSLIESDKSCNDILIFLSESSKDSNLNSLFVMGFLPKYDRELFSKITSYHDSKTVKIGLNNKSGYYSEDKREIQKDIDNHKRIVNKLLSKLKKAINSFEKENSCEAKNYKEEFNSTTIKSSKDNDGDKVYYTDNSHGVSVSFNFEIK